MNARQKCKKLKKQLKELEKLADKPILGYVVKTQSVPIDQFQVKCVISRDDPEFQFPEDLQEKMVKNFFASRYAELFKDHFHITEIKEDARGKTYYMSIWMGQDE
jgi:hypothetical protein